ncbi:uncharacterized protein LOC130014732 [Mercurialis annua]|uniref:uncharacterized protein LOC130014732 n=1 Tax=Mercurialis annua TaxID=3986 RepID=UPI0024AE17C2|nr:uncharacterized protein LOC130014732 [Mercurialis annua]
MILTIPIGYGIAARALTAVIRVIMIADQRQKTMLTDKILNALDLASPNELIGQCKPSLKLQTNTNHEFNPIQSGCPAFTGPVQQLIRASLLHTSASCHHS